MAGLTTAAGGVEDPECWEKSDGLVTFTVLHGATMTATLDTTKANASMTYPVCVIPVDAPTRHQRYALWSEHLGTQRDFSFVASKQVTGTRPLGMYHCGYAEEGLWHWFTMEVPMRTVKYSAAATSLTMQFDFADDERVVGITCRTTAPTGYDCTRENTVDMMPIDSSTGFPSVSLRNLTLGTGYTIIARPIFADGTLGLPTLPVKMVTLPPVEASIANAGDSYVILRIGRPSWSGPLNRDMNDDDAVTNETIAELWEDPTPSLIKNAKRLSAKRQLHRVPLQRRRCEIKTLKNGQRAIESFEGLRPDTDHFLIVRARSNTVVFDEPVRVRFRTAKLLQILPPCAASASSLSLRWSTQTIGTPSLCSVDVDFPHQSNLFKDESEVDSVSGAASPNPGASPSPRRLMEPESKQGDGTTTAISVGDQPKSPRMIENDGQSSARHRGRKSGPVVAISTPGEEGAAQPPGSGAVSARASSAASSSGGGRKIYLGPRARHFPDGGVWGMCPTRTNCDLEPTTFEVACRAVASGTTHISPAGPDASVTVTGLESSTVYEIRIRAVMTIDGRRVHSPWCNPLMFMTPSTTLARATRRTTSDLTVSWGMHGAPPIVPTAPHRKRYQPILTTLTDAEDESLAPTTTSGYFYYIEALPFLHVDDAAQRALSDSEEEEFVTDSDNDDEADNGAGTEQEGTDGTGKKKKAWKDMTRAEREEEERLQEEKRIEEERQAEIEKKKLEAAQRLIELEKEEREKQVTPLPRRRKSIAQELGMTEPEEIRQQIAEDKAQKERNASRRKSSAPNPTDAAALLSHAGDAEATEAARKSAVQAHASAAAAKTGTDGEAEAEKRKSGRMRILNPDPLPLPLTDLPIDITGVSEETTIVVAKGNHPMPRLREASDVNAYDSDVAHDWALRLAGGGRVVDVDDTTNDRSADRPAQKATVFLKRGAGAGTAKFIDLDPHSHYTVLLFSGAAPQQRLLPDEHFVTTTLSEGTILGEDVVKAHAAGAASPQSALEAGDASASMHPALWCNLASERLRPGFAPPPKLHIDELSEVFVTLGVEPPPPPGAGPEDEAGPTSTSTHDNESAGLHSGPGHRISDDLSHGHVGSSVSAGHQTGGKSKHHRPASKTPAAEPPLAIFGPDGEIKLSELPTSTSTTAAVAAAVADAHAKRIASSAAVKQVQVNAASPDVGISAYGDLVPGTRAGGPRSLREEFEAELAIAQAKEARAAASGDATVDAERAPVPEVIGLAAKPGDGRRVAQEGANAGARGAGLQVVRGAAEAAMLQLLADRDGFSLDIEPHSSDSDDDGDARSNRSKSPTSLSRRSSASRANAPRNARKNSSIALIGAPAGMLMTKDNAGNVTEVSPDAPRSRPRSRAGSEVSLVGSDVSRGSGRDRPWRRASLSFVARGVEAVAEFCVNVQRLVSDSDGRTIPEGPEARLYYCTSRTRVPVVGLAAATQYELKLSRMSNTTHRWGQWSRPLLVTTVQRLLLEVDSVTSEFVKLRWGRDAGPSDEVIIDYSLTFACRTQYKSAVKSGKVASKSKHRKSHVRGSLHHKSLEKHTQKDDDLSRPFAKKTTASSPKKIKVGDATTDLPPGGDVHSPTSGRGQQAGLDSYSFATDEKEKDDATKTEGQVQTRTPNVVASTSDAGQSLHSPTSGGASVHDTSKAPTSTAADDSASSRSGDESQSDDDDDDEEGDDGESDDEEEIARAAKNHEMPTTVVAEAPEARLFINSDELMPNTAYDAWVVPRYSNGQVGMPSNTIRFHQVTVKSRVDECGCDHLRVSWDLVQLKKLDVASANGLLIARLRQGTHWLRTLAVHPTDTSVTFTNLIPGTVYHASVTLAAVSLKGSGCTDPTEVVPYDVAFATSGRTLTPPAAEVRKVGETAIELEWSYVAEDEEAETVCAQVKCVDKRRDGFEVVVNSSVGKPQGQIRGSGRAFVDGLFAGRLYTVFVRQQFRHGTWSEWTETVSQCPTLPRLRVQTVAVGDGSITLQAHRPTLKNSVASDGIISPAKYRFAVEHIGTGQVHEVVSKKSAVVIEGLESNAPYTCIAGQWGAASWGEPSLPVHMYTLQKLLPTVWRRGVNRLEIGCRRDQRLPATKTDLCKPHTTRTSQEFSKLSQVHIRVKSVIDSDVPPMVVTSTTQERNLTSVAFLIDDLRPAHPFRVDLSCSFAALQTDQNSAGAPRDSTATTGSDVNGNGNGNGNENRNENGSRGTDEHIGSGRAPSVSQKPAEVGGDDAPPELSFTGTPILSQHSASLSTVTLPMPEISIHHLGEDSVTVGWAPSPPEETPSHLPMLLAMAPAVRQALFEGQAIEPDFWDVRISGTTRRAEHIACFQHATAVEAVVSAKAETGLCTVPGLMPRTSYTLSMRPRTVQDVADGIASAEEVAECGAVALLSAQQRAEEERRTRRQSQSGVLSIENTLSGKRHAARYIDIGQVVTAAFAQLKVEKLSENFAQISWANRMLSHEFRRGSVKLRSLNSTLRGDELEKANRARVPVVPDGVTPDLFELVVFARPQLNEDGTAPPTAQPLQITAPYKDGQVFVENLQYDTEYIVIGRKQHRVGGHAAALGAWVPQVQFATLQLLILRVVAVSLDFVNVTWDTDGSAHARAEKKRIQRIEREERRQKELALNEKEKSETEEKRRARAAIVGAGSGWMRRQSTDTAQSDGNSPIDRGTAESAEKMSASSSAKASGANDRPRGSSADVNKGSNRRPGSGSVNKSKTGATAATADDDEVGEDDDDDEQIHNRRESAYLVEEEDVPLMDGTSTGKDQELVTAAMKDLQRKQQQQQLSEVEKDGNGEGDEPRNGNEKSGGGAANPNSHLSASQQSGAQKADDDDDVYSVGPFKSPAGSRRPSLTGTSRGQSPQKPKGVSKPAGKFARTIDIDDGRNAPTSGSPPKNRNSRRGSLLQDARVFAENNGDDADGNVGGSTNKDMVGRGPGSRRRVSTHELSPVISVSAAGGGGEASDNSRKQTVPRGESKSPARAGAAAAGSTRDRALRRGSNSPSFRDKESRSPARSNNGGERRSSRNATPSNRRSGGATTKNGESSARENANGGDAIAGVASAGKSADTDSPVRHVRQTSTSLLLRPSGSVSAPAAPAAPAFDTNALEDDDQVVPLSGRSPRRPRSKVGMDAPDDAPASARFSRTSKSPMRSGRSSIGTGLSAFAPEMMADEDELLRLPPQFRGSSTFFSSHAGLVAECSSATAAEFQVRVMSCNDQNETQKFCHDIFVSETDTNVHTVNGLVPDQRYAVAMRVCYDEIAGTWVRPCFFHTDPVPETSVVSVSQVRAEFTFKALAAQSVFLRRRPQAIANSSFASADANLAAGAFTHRSPMSPALAATSSTVNTKDHQHASEVVEPVSGGGQGGVRPTPLSIDGAGKGVASASSAAPNPYLTGEARAGGDHESGGAAGTTDGESDGLLSPLPGHIGGSLLAPLTSPVLGPRAGGSLPPSAAFNVDLLRRSSSTQQQPPQNQPADAQHLPTASTDGVTSTVPAAATGLQGGGNHPLSDPDAAQASVNTAGPRVDGVANDGVEGVDPSLAAAVPQFAFQSGGATATSATMAGSHPGERWIGGRQDRYIQQREEAERLAKLARESIARENADEEAQREARRRASSSVMLGVTSASQAPPVGAETAPGSPNIQLPPSTLPAPITAGVGVPGVSAAPPPANVALPSALRSPGGGAPPIFSEGRTARPASGTHERSETRAASKSPEAVIPRALWMSTGSVQSLPPAGGAGASAASVTTPPSGKGPGAGIGGKQTQGQMQMQLSPTSLQKRMSPRSMSESLKSPLSPLSPNRSRPGDAPGIVRGGGGGGMSLSSVHSGSETGVGLDLSGRDNFNHHLDPDFFPTERLAVGVFGGSTLDGDGEAVQVLAPPPSKGGASAVTSAGASVVQTLPRRASQVTTSEMIAANFSSTSSTRIANLSTGQHDIAGPNGPNGPATVADASAATAAGLMVQEGNTEQDDVVPISPSAAGAGSLGQAVFPFDPVLAMFGLSQVPPRRHRVYEVCVQELSRNDAPQRIMCEERTVGQLILPQLKRDQFYHIMCRELIAGVPYGDFVELSTLWTQPYPPIITDMSECRDGLATITWGVMDNEKVGKILSGRDIPSGFTFSLERGFRRPADGLCFGWHEIAVTTNPTVRFDYRTPLAEYDHALQVFTQKSQSPLAGGSPFGVKSSRPQSKSPQKRPGSREDARAASRPRGASPLANLVSAVSGALQSGTAGNTAPGGCGANSTLPPEERFDRLCFRVRMSKLWVAKEPGSEEKVPVWGDYSEVGHWLPQPPPTAVRRLRLAIVGNEYACVQWDLPDNYQSQPGLKFVVYLDHSRAQDVQALSVVGGVATERHTAQRTSVVRHETGATAGKGAREQSTSEASSAAALTGPEWLLIGETKFGHMEIPRLSPNCVYRVAVRAESNFGKSPAAAIVTLATRPTPNPVLKDFKPPRTKGIGANGVVVTGVKPREHSQLAPRNMYDKYSIPKAQRLRALTALAGIQSKDVQRELAAERFIAAARRVIVMQNTVKRSALSIATAPEFDPNGEESALAMAQGLYGVTDTDLIWNDNLFMMPHHRGKGTSHLLTLGGGAGAGGKKNSKDVQSTRRSGPHVGAERLVDKPTTSRSPAGKTPPRRSPGRAMKNVASKVASRMSPRDGSPRPARRPTPPLLGIGSSSPGALAAAAAGVAKHEMDASTSVSGARDSQLQGQGGKSASRNEESVPAVFKTSATPASDETLSASASKPLGGDQGQHPGGLGEWSPGDPAALQHRLSAPFSTTPPADGSVQVPQAQAVPQAHGYQGQQDQTAGLLPPMPATFGASSTSTTPAGARAPGAQGGGASVTLPQLSASATGRDPSGKGHAVTDAPKPVAGRSKTSTAWGDSTTTTTTERGVGGVKVGAKTGGKPKKAQPVTHAPRAGPLGGPMRASTPGPTRTAPLGSTDANSSASGRPTAGTPSPVIPTYGADDGTTRPLSIPGRIDAPRGSNVGGPLSSVSGAESGPSQSQPSLSSQQTPHPLSHSATPMAHGSGLLTRFSSIGSASAAAPPAGANAPNTNTNAPTFAMPAVIPSALGAMSAGGMTLTSAAGSVTIAGAPRRKAGAKASKKLPSQRYGGPVRDATVTLQTVNAERAKLQSEQEKKRAPGLGVSRSPITSPVQPASIAPPSPSDAALLLSMNSGGMALGGGSVGAPGNGGGSAVPPTPLGSTHPQVHSPSEQGHLQAGSHRPSASVMTHSTSGAPMTPLASGHHHHTSGHGMSKGSLSMGPSDRLGASTTGGPRVHGSWGTGFVPSPVKRRRRREPPVQETPPAPAVAVDPPVKLGGQGIAGAPGAALRRGM